jgi:N-sulfoglucosamine sulfohydrolase
MPFPYAKANVQEYGTHVPLAISLPDGVKNKVVDQPVGLIDLAPTLMDLMGLSGAMETTGKSLIPVLKNIEKIKHRDYVLTGRERHTHARPDNLGYPSRAIRSKDFLHVYNFFPELWPAGDPVVKNDINDKRDQAKGFKTIYPGYHDVDPSPTKDEIMKIVDDKTFDLAFSKRPLMQLYDIKKDPFCKSNIAELQEYNEILTDLHNELIKRLKEQGDPRVTGNPIFDSYPRYSTMRNFPGFNKRGTYNPKY